MICLLLFEPTYGAGQPVLAKKNSAEDKLDLDVVDELNQHKQIVGGSTYDFKIYNNVEKVKFARVYFDRDVANPDDELQGATLLNAIIDGYNADNGYIVIYEDDVDAWIQYYGKTNDKEFVDAIKSKLTRYELSYGPFGTDTAIFYNHAEVAQFCGGSPGEYYYFSTGPDRLQMRIRNTKRYNNQQDPDASKRQWHEIHLTAPDEAEAGVPVTITASTRDGSYFVTNSQKWTITIDGPDGLTYKMHQVPVWVDINTRRAVQSINHTFVRSGNYTITFSIEDASFHSDQTTGTNHYSITKQITVFGELRADFTVEPSTVRHGDAFVLKPQILKIPAGRTVQKVEYTIYSPDRNQSHTITTNQAVNKNVFPFEYPPFFSSTMTQTYPIDMIVTDNTGETSPVVTRHVTIVVADILADFDILPSQTLKFRDSFTFVPKDVDLDGLTYSYHRYRIQKDGVTYITPPIYGLETATTYHYATYPSIISVGEHDVEIEVVTKEGKTSGWQGRKKLTLLNPATNSPPQFQVAWVRPYDLKTPVTMAVQGETLHLIYIDDPSVPTPYDPDGDALEFLGFDFTDSSSWAKTIPTKYEMHVDGYRNIKMDTLGVHSATGMMRDQWGALATSRATVQVVPPNPIPVPTCPIELKENRPVDPSLFSAHLSYSPAGRAIDHSRNEWINVLPSYVNGTGQDLVIKVGLHVYDSAGLKSLEPGECTFILKPDLPPIGELGVPPFALRDQEVDIFNQSWSPDGDKIVSAQYRYKYDAENDGFDNDPWVNLAGNLFKSSLTPQKVGKYLFDVYVCEDYGQCAWASDTQDEALRTMDVVNLAPKVSFKMEGENQQPNPDIRINLSPVEILNNWGYYAVNSSTPGSFKNLKWRHAGDQLIAGLGYRNSLPYKRTATLTSYLHVPFVDNGYGLNTLSPFRAIKGEVFVQPLLAQKSDGTYYAPNTMPYNVQSNGKYVFYIHQPNATIYALNIARIGSYRGYLDISSLPYVWKHEYENGNDPVEFTIPQRRMTMNTYYYNYYSKEYSKTGEVTPQGQLVNYLVTDRTLYVVTLYNCSCIVDNDGDYRTYYAIEVATYDAFTGDFINSWSTNSIENNIYNYYTSSKELHARNDQLVLFSSLKTNDSSRGLLIVEVFNRNAELVQRKEVMSQASHPYTDEYNRQMTCYYYFQDYGKGWMFQDLDGNFYLYEYQSCSYEYSSYPPAFVSYFVKLNASTLSLEWRTELKGARPTYQYSNKWYNDIYRADDVYLAFFNPFTKEWIVRSYDLGQIVLGYPEMIEHFEVINAQTGEKRDWTSYKFGVDGNRYLALNWNGSYNNTKSLYTADGLRTYYQENDDYLSGRNYVYNNSTIYNSWNRVGYTLDYYVESGWSSGYSTSRQLFQQYVADGVYLVGLNVGGGNSAGGSQNFGYVFALAVGEPSDLPMHPAASIGQFVSPDARSNLELSFHLAMQEVNLDNKLAGFSFRMQDPRNRYAVETDGKQLYLSKYVNGSRTVLRSANYPFQSRTSYAIKVTASGNHLQVYLNGVPYLEATDSTYTSGTYGPFSDKPNVTFSSMTLREVSPPDVQWMSHYAIWEEGQATATVRYSDITFEDPENDPMAGTFQWTIQHTPRFLNNQGLSSLHGKTFTSPQLTFDKVGDYVVTLGAQDDPHPEFLYPSDVFAEYRKAANPFQNRITVHRRPVAQFTLSFNPDHTIRWNDTSYDPDRWLSPAQYSTEPTGIDYAATRGVLERKYYTITPSGQIVYEKLVSPYEAGTYTVGLSVKDEYGAWSYWAEQTITVTTPVPPDEPPVAGFTVTPATAYRGQTVTVNSTAYDKEDGSREHLPHEYYVRKEGGAETFRSNSRTSWTTSFSELGTYTIRQVVMDSKGQVDQAEQQVTVVNRKPVTQVTMPAGTTAANPTILDTDKPTIRFTYSDADGDAQQAFRVIIRNASTNAIVVQSGDVASGETEWAVTASLAEGIVYAVESQVFDGYEWSEVSVRKYMRIVLNRPPVADFDWTPKPVWEGDTVQLINLSADPDGDPLHFVWTITDPLDDTVILTGTNDPDSNGIRRVFSQPGMYRVTLQASDGRTAHSVTKTIEALPLSIEPDVLHTPEWYAHHVERGHNTTVHPKDFYAGERFVLRVIPSPAPVVSVRAWMSAIGLSGEELYTETALSPEGAEANSGSGSAFGTNTGTDTGTGVGSAAGAGTGPGAGTAGAGTEPDTGTTAGAGTETGPPWTGELYDGRWMSLTDGLGKGVYDIHFEIRYANGTVKTATVPVNMIGNALGTAGVHRVR